MRSKISRFFYRSRSIFIIFTVMIVMFCVLYLLLSQPVFDWMDYQNYGPHTIPNEVMVGGEQETSRRIEIFWLAPYTEVSIPQRSAVDIVRLKRTDGQWEKRAYIDFNNGRNRRQVYLGPLTYQLPDTPIQTIMFELGGTRFIIGCVDEQIKGTLQFIDFSNFNNDQIHIDSINAAIGPPRCFYITHGEWKMTIWKSIGRIDISTRESLDKLRREKQGGIEWEKKYDPPIEIAPLLIHVNAPTDIPLTPSTGGK